MRKWKFWMGVAVLLLEVTSGYGQLQNGLSDGQKSQQKGRPENQWEGQPEKSQWESQVERRQWENRWRKGRFGAMNAGQDTVLWRMSAYLEQLWGVGDGDDAEALEADQMQRARAYEHFEQLLEHPLPINRASRRELEELFILSDFQITSLLAYRQEHGAILSSTELSLLNGFNWQTAALLKYFVEFDPGTIGRKPSGNFFRDCRSELLLKTGITLEQTRQGWLFPEEEWPRSPEKSKSSGEGVPERPAVSPVYTYLRYGCNYLDRVQVGVTLENDAGERLLGPGKVPLSDFFSFHAAFKQLQIGKIRAEVILGDFSARFGQGLTLWKSFRLSGASTPSGLHKRGASASPYASSGESDFLRGVAVCAGRELPAGGVLGLRAWEMTAVFSYNGVDARIEDGKYTSVIQGGLHRSPAEINNRKTMHETVAGFHAVILFSRWKLGISWTTYGYDKPNGRRVAEYNKWQMYNGIWGNLSADFYAVAGRFRFFGEAALDYGGRFAGLAGVLWQGGELEAGILGRRYAQGYIAPHAGGYSSTSSGCYNQTGITLNVRWSKGRVFALSGDWDITHYPGVRYGIPASSSVVKGSVKGEYERGRWNGYLRLSERFSTYKGANKFGVKGLCGYRMFENLRLGLKGEWVTAGERETVRQWASGYVLGGELDYTTQRGGVRIRIGGNWFDAPQWSVRMYGYEAGLPASYGSVLFYGTGAQAYVTAKIRLGRLCDLHGKMAVSGHKKGGGENDLPAPRFKVQLGLKMKF